MDSTTSDPQPHQLQAPPSAPASSTTSSSQSSQIPAQHQHYHQQPPQQHQPKPHQNQQPHHQHPAHQHQHPHHPPIHHPSASTQQANFQYTQGPCIRTPCVYGSPYTHTTQYPHYMANFPVPQPQQLTTTVVQHMQSPVPHSVYNKSSTSMINQVLVTDRLHNQNLQLATSHNQVATTKDPQERKKAVLKDPNTMKEIPWDSSKSTSSSSTTKETTNTSTPPTTTIASGEHITTFLQKVSETTNSEGTNNNKQQNKRPQQQNKKPTIVSNVAEDKQVSSEAFPSINATIANEKATVPTTTSSTKTTNINSATTANINTNNISTTDATPTTITSSSTAIITPTTTTETTPSVPQLTNKNNERPLKTDQHNVNKSVEAEKPQSAAVQQPAQTLLQKVSEDCLDSSPPTNNGQGLPKDKKIIGSTNDDDKRELQDPPSFPATSPPKSLAIVSDKDGDNDSNKENENKPDCEKINGDVVTKVEKSEEEKEASNDSKTDDKKEKDSEKVTLKYEPGQYNPISNKDGKKIYSRQFLLDVKESIRDTLEPERELESYDRNTQVDFFCPQFSAGGQRLNSTNRQNEPARRQSQYNYAGRSSAGQEKQRKVINSVSLTQEVELKTTSNPWRPTKEIKEDVPNNVTETESLKKKFRSILNKLTPDNFENLKKAVTELDINTESNLGEVIDIVFAKALAEPGYCVLYGQMCSHLKKITAGTANFGTILLQRCQQQFQSDIYSGLNLKERKENIENEQSPDVKKQLNEELYEEMFRCRMRGLGLIKFIGELYKIEMLNDQIMFDCVIRLLSDTSEESLECLCDLLTTIGEKLDRSTSQKVAEKEKKAPRSASKANAYQGGQKSAAAVVASGSTSSQQQKAAQQQQASVTTLDQVFEQLHKIRKSKDLPLAVRIRFKLLDTCELREKYNWQSKKTKDNNPKKTKEIREAHQEKLEKERQQNAMGPRRSQEGRRGLGHSGGSSSQLSSLANESGGNRGKLNMHTSSSSHLLRDPSLGDNMKTNHTDIDAIKEHQRKLEGFKGIATLANTTKPPSDDQTPRLGPTSLRPLFRPQSNLGPAGRSAASTTTTPSSTAVEPAQK